jgi:hypothetical protein
VLNRLALSQYPPDSYKRIQAFISHIGIWIDQTRLYINPSNKRQLYRWKDTRPFGCDPRGQASWSGAVGEDDRVPSTGLNKHTSSYEAQRADDLQEKVQYLEKKLQSLRMRSSRLASIKALLGAPQNPFLDMPFPKADVSRVKGTSFGRRFKVRTFLPVALVRFSVMLMQTLFEIKRKRCWPNWKVMEENKTVSSGSFKATSNVRGGLMRIAGNQSRPGERNGYKSLTRSSGPLLVSTGNKPSMKRLSEFKKRTNTLRNAKRYFVS